MKEQQDKLYNIRWAASKIKSVSGDVKVNDLADFIYQRATEALGLEDRERVNSIHRMKYQIPEIIPVKAKIKTRGAYQTGTGKARGLVVHFTAGRSADGRHDAVRTLRYLASRGLGCMVMDTAGRIYMGYNQDLDEWASHAGKSSWKGQNWVSRLCMGMEICNAGFLGSDNKSWFGKSYDMGDVRVIAEDRHNIKAGNYHKFTDAQELALANFVLWQIDTNPEFDLEWVVGHDEVAPGRKLDPGGSLSQSMPEFRAFINKILKR